MSVRLVVTTDDAATAEGSFMVKHDPPLRRQRKRKPWMPKREQVRWVTPWRLVEVGDAWTWHRIGEPTSPRAGGYLHVEGPTVRGRTR